MSQGRRQHRSTKGPGLEEEFKFESRQWLQAQGHGEKTSQCPVTQRPRSLEPFVCFCEALDSQLQGGREGTATLCAPVRGHYAVLRQWLFCSSIERRTCVFGATCQACRMDFITGRGYQGAPI